MGPCPDEPSMRKGFCTIALLWEHHCADTRFVVEAYPRANSGLFFCRRRLVHVCLIMTAMAQVACWQASRLPATTTTTAHYYSLPLTMGLFQDMPPRAGICRSAHPFPARSLVYSYSYAA